MEIFGFFSFSLSRALRFFSSSLQLFLSPQIDRSLTSQKNSLPFREQNQVIQETTSLF